MPPLQDLSCSSAKHPPLLTHGPLRPGYALVMRRPPRSAWQLRVGMLVGGLWVHVWAVRPGCARVTQRISMPLLQDQSCSSADHLPPWTHGPLRPGCALVMHRPPRPAWQLRVGMLVGGFRVHVWAMRPGCARVTQRISMPPLQVLSCSSADHLPPWMRGPFEARLCLRHASASQGSMATRSWHATGWPSGSCVGREAGLRPCHTQDLNAPTAGSQLQ